ncbi:hypothetical protein Airi02_032100 [Actinoallomurus iriomotensis]|uniref:Uncharacterized protein n=1 Tax=Actinoallomurus iriomotensis TaxID=478107 RepID=A0A9W6W0U4_9ACTN|nr:hypothetical protein Airi01_039090 [Actinoallomurus iriomotensis]GLY85281.1 hypothetical protein Airi02_032100 [Actinoallomurus iriomotensis]
MHPDKAPPRPECAGHIADRSGVPHVTTSTRSAPASAARPTEPRAAVVDHPRRRTKVPASQGMTPWLFRKVPLKLSD